MQTTLRLCKCDRIVIKGLRWDRRAELGRKGGLEPAWSGKLGRCVGVSCPQPRSQLLRGLYEQI